MKVLLVKREIYSQVGGAERVFVDLANEMLKRGHDVEVMCAQKHIFEDEKPFYPLNQAVVIHNVYPLLKRGVPGTGSNGRGNTAASSGPVSFKKRIKMKIKAFLSGDLRILGRAIYYYTTKFTFTDKIFWKLIFGDQISRLRTDILHLQPDVVVSFLPNSFVPVSKAIEGTGIKLVIANRNDPAEDYTRRNYFPSRYDVLMRMEAVKKSDLNLVQLEVFKDFFPEIVKEKTRVIPNSVNIYESEQNRIEYPDGLGSGVIVSVGRLTEVKNHELLIRAFSLISKKYPGWIIRIFGEGRHERFLCKLIDKLGLSDRVYLMGSTKDIIGEYRNADIFAFPSRFEGFSNALAEAMSLGLPSVVIKGCISNRELVEKGEAGLISENDYADYAEKLEFLINNPGVRKGYGFNAVNFVKQFEKERIYNMWDDAITGVIKKNQ